MALKLHHCCHPIVNHEQHNQSSLKQTHSIIAIPWTDTKILVHCWYTVRHRSTKTVPTVYQKQSKDSQNSKNNHWCTNRHMSTQSPPNTQSPRPPNTDWLREEHVGQTSSVWSNYDDGWMKHWLHAASCNTLSINCFLLSVSSWSRPTNWYQFVSALRRKSSFDIVMVKSRQRLTLLHVGVSTSSCSRLINNVGDSYSGYETRLVEIDNF